VLGALSLLMVGDPRHFFYGDTQAAYYGWWYHLGAEVRAGHWPLLDPHAWRAGDLAAEGQWGLWSPLVIGIGLLTTVCSSVLGLATAVKLVLVCTGVLGVFRVVRSYGVSAPLAYAAAVAAPMGGMTQYLDLPSWAAALMIWALFPWVWWALRRTMLLSAHPVTALAIGYLLVTVGYVYGTIMLIFLLVACLVEVHLAANRVARRNVLLVGALLGLVAMTVYLPGVLTVSVTTRSNAVGGFGGKFSTEPLSLLASVLPTAATPGTSAHLLPYAYLCWFLPVLLWVDVARLRARWREVAGPAFLAGTMLLVVDGPAHLGPLRWPLRLHPFLLQTGLVLLVVVLHRYGVRRPSPRRLGLSLLWAVLAAVLASVRAPSMVTAHLVGLALVVAGVVALWALARSGRLAALGLVAGLVTVLALGVQHLTYPTLPSPQRNMPVAKADYTRQLAGTRGDVMVVGSPEPGLEDDPGWTRDFLIASAWYLNPHRVQNTYTTISFNGYHDRYCMTFQGDTCPDALTVLLAREPSTGKRRVDLLGVSTLLLVRRDFPASVLASPPSGWRVVATTPRAVTWVRSQPVPGAGHVVWGSAGTTVTGVSSDDRTVRFRVDRLPASGGRVVLSALAWPSYATDTGTLGPRVDGYLVSVDLPRSAVGKVVTVRFSPPGWPVEVACWCLALLAGAAWSVAWTGRRRRVSGAGRWSASRRRG